MTSFHAEELARVNAQIVGHLLAQRSPPRELIARRAWLRTAAEAARRPDQMNRAA